MRALFTLSGFEQQLDANVGGSAGRCHAGRNAQQRRVERLTPRAGTRGGIEQRDRHCRGQIGLDRDVQVLQLAGDERLRLQDDGVAGRRGRRGFQRCDDDFRVLDGVVHGSPSWLTRLVYRVRNFARSRPRCP
ncbi:MAG: hypothetical protein ABL916_19020 [Burkholderiaceae bacterium]